MKQHEEYNRRYRQFSANIEQFLIRSILFLTVLLLIGQLYVLFFPPLY